MGLLYAVAGMLTIGAADFSAAIAGRRTKRQRRRLWVRLWNDEFEASGFTADISATGLLIEATQPLEIGTRFHLEIFLADRSFFTECVVARKKTYPSYARSMFKPGVGIRFVGFAEAIRQVAEEADEADEGLLQVDLRDMETLKTVYEQDIKFGGLLVRTKELPEIESELIVPILLPEPHGTIQCRGSVVKIFSDPPRVALRLADTDQVRGRLMEIISPRE